MIVAHTGPHAPMNTHEPSCGGWAGDEGLYVGMRYENVVLLMIQYILEYVIMISELQ